jgi:hypothetical protein
MNADRHCEGGSVARYEAKQSSGTQMTQITRMNANLYNKRKRICADLCHLCHLRSPFGERASGTDSLSRRDSGRPPQSALAVLSRRDNMLVERKNIHTIFPTVPSGTECAGGNNVRFFHSYSVPYGTVGISANDIFYQHSVPNGTAPVGARNDDPHHPRSKRANTQVRPYNFQIFKSSNNKL